MDHTPKFLAPATKVRPRRHIPLEVSGISIIDHGTMNSNPDLCGAEDAISPVRAFMVRVHG